MQQSHVTAEFLKEQGLSPTFPARFFANVHITDSCWIWTGFRSSQGRKYGSMYTGPRSKSEQILAHRASWILHFGAIPPKMLVLHDCPDWDNKLCVCPAHLWLGNHSENLEDAWTKRRRNPNYGEKSSRHKLTVAQVNAILALRGEPKTRGVYRRLRLAEMFGVCKSTIDKVMQGRNWSSSSQ